MNVVFHERLYHEQICYERGLFWTNNVHVASYILCYRGSNANKFGFMHRNVNK